MADFLDMARVGATYDGVVYGYPLGSETYALFYNKDILPEAPKTWDEVVAYAKKFNNKAENKYALVWPVADGYYGYMFMESFGAPLFGPKGNDRKQHNLNSPAAIKGLTYFQNLRKQILDIPAADASGDFCNAEFTEGKAAMIITGPWKINDFKKAGINFGITTVPAFTLFGYIPFFSFIGFANQIFFSHGAQKATNLSYIYKFTLYRISIFIEFRCVFIL